MGTSSKKKNIVIFASGSGSNAQRLLEQFAHHPHIQVAALFSNNPQAFALQRAQNFGVPTAVFDRAALRAGEVQQQVQAYAPDLIVLAGFLWLLPASFVQAFPNKIINIHPSLLPKFGGKGMHGQHVHQAVIEAQETQTGITIHYVNEHYDEGAPIFQEFCPVQPHDTCETLAARVLTLEHQHLPRVVEELLSADKDSPQTPAA
ncbi:phosphoribosylglycinamide formyltransferase [Rufibacter glacialis]|uniref:Phosphoribosylglycinamide formyltransferase n=1 Tax=Rufibacter glacialis TaxID=1259555 RepID=A0A5M8QKA1_9BACT|nr:phosphoribosylglycinamide formyltransferase [Rufibacter glacialis]KAA6435414.1 phosphoribosylglycinamide formyltransferase [Rufibacter glacialis]GGK63177.1 phosphoribosylglycinamide formyltransferase [Rufibacter glacialis]